ncbi:related to conserved membrane protein, putative [Rhynchosporium secalis]|uniref:Related to conserved membrane protein, putative n=1 Tax=Rhynchosporium secalis TaxID=38038 RepID=A0A1E1LXN5_RHYSE|nr:related to conserved membrane protein, putative [Rhynchosporium secalis]
MAFLAPFKGAKPTPLLITVRFTTSIPDLLLDIEDADNTTVIALKHLLRLKLDPPTSQHRYRFIHSGKLLKDDDILSEVLKIPLPPPPAADPKGKGKAVEPSPPRVYINCSIGDALTSAELAAEAVAALASTDKTKKRDRSETREGGSRPLKSTTIAPRGFNRLLTAGFTAAEVNQLRLQFRSIQENIHTPDTMPSSETLLRMEDAWIDDNAGNAGAGAGAAGGGGFDFGDDGIGGGALDDLLWGSVMGFLWPLGCIGWLIREPGVWSGRRQIAVFMGFMISLGAGMLRVIS